LSWFDIIKKPLISIPKGSVRIKKPKKIETKEECLPKIKKWLGDVSRIIANEPDFKITFAKSSGVCEVEEFNIPEEFACRMLEAMSDKTTKGFTALTSPNVAYLDGELTEGELHNHFMPLMEISTEEYYQRKAHANYDSGYPNVEDYYSELMYTDWGEEQLTPERWAEVLSKIEDVMP